MIQQVEKLVEKKLLEAKSFELVITAFSEKKNKKETSKSDLDLTQEKNLSVKVFCSFYLLNLSNHLSNFLQTFLLLLLLNIEIFSHRNELLLTDPAYRDILILSCVFVI